MATSEIEKLERRYSENPHGLTFAPLAEVHRKNGDIARALELLTAGLELHPNYIPASIVLGRCHQDLGDFPAAEAAFAHVLRLDDENVIALKSLADINERLERYDHAVSWLRRLVAVDRSNEEAREQLRRLELVNNGRPSPAPAATTESPIETAPKGPEEQGPPKRPSGEMVVLELPPPDRADFDISQPVSKTAEPTAVAPPDVATPEPSEEPRRLVLERTQEFSEEAAGEIPSITDRPEPARTGSVPQMPGLVSQEFEPPKGPLGPPLESLEIDVETSDEVVLEGSGASEYRVPDASEDLGQLSFSGGAVSEYQTPDASEEFKALAEARATQAKAAADAKAAAEAKAAAKARAAAEAKAAAAAREAIERKPDEEAKSPKRLYTARETQGQSVAAFFRGMLAARPPAEMGEAGRSPQDGLPLGPGMGPEGAAKGDTEVSFDDFFGGQSKVGEADKADEPGRDDLDQFQSWLQNLKR